MLNFTSSTRQDYSNFARSLWLNRDQFTSHEQASQFVVESLFNEFIQKNGESQLALVRIFRLTDVSDLPPDVHSKVDVDEKKVMALTGTWGVEKAWQHRSRSQGHQVIPISQIAIPEKIPMFQEILTQLGIDIERFYRTKEIAVDRRKPYQGRFHIPDATSSVIPAQANFIDPYQIKSLVGFGGFMGLYGVLFLLYAFACVPVSAEAAEAFYTMQEFLGTTIAIDDKVFAE